MVKKFKKFLVRLSYAFARIRSEGLYWTVGELSRRGYLWVLWLILLPITFIGHLFGYRRLPVITQRIGHLAAEIDCFLKLLEMGEISTKNKKFFLLAPPGQVANYSLLEYWKKYLIVITNPTLCKLLGYMTRGILMRHDISDYVLGIGQPARYCEVNAKWNKRPPLLKISKTHREIGEKALRIMGIPKGAWYVCVHARESGYSPKDEAVHDYRNCSIESMIPAMKEIVKRGGWCIRVGDSSMKPIQKIPGVIDYVHHSLMSPEIDVFLCGTCNYFLGNTSGLFILSSVFGVISALTNMVPMSSLGFGKDDLNIFKMFLDKNTGEYLSAAKVMQLPIIEYRMSSSYNRSGYELINNTALEIMELAIEMYERIEGKFVEIPQDRKMMDNFHKLLKPNHYCFGSQSKIASTFLRRHQHIFDS